MATNTDTNPAALTTHLTAIRTNGALAGYSLMPARKYSITSRFSGFYLGTYPGATPAAALDAMAREAGYQDYARCCEVTGEDASDLLVEEED